MEISDLLIKRGLPAAGLVFQPMVLLPLRTLSNGTYLGFVTLSGEQAGVLRTYVN